MPINIATITPASLKVKEVATEEYVDTAVSNAVISDTTWQTKVQEALDSNTTTIDGARITTGSIAADKIVANSINANILSADAINGKTIKGSIIEGASILGSIIKSSWIDYSSTGHLTDWKYFTLTTVPEEYRSNFAFDNYNNIISDSEGYVRLPGVLELYSSTKTASLHSSGNLVLTGSDEVYAYDSYTLSSERRCIKLRPRLISVNDNTIGTFSADGNMHFMLGAYSIDIYGAGNNLNVYANNSLIVGSGYEWVLPYGILLIAIAGRDQYYNVSNWNVMFKTQTTLFTEDFIGSNAFLRNLSVNSNYFGSFLAIPSYYLN